jgi:hypothetical protein
MPQHGGLLVRTRADCRSCHHTQPLVQRCAACHADDARSERVFEAARTFALPLGAARARALPFRHAPHEGVACATCHTGSSSLTARATDCASCHADHHGARADCSACHVPAPASVHPLTVHAGCGGTGCHTDPAIVPTPRTRPSCLVCHAEQSAHRPGQDCAGCHVLPPAAAVEPVGLVHPVRPR